MFFEEHLLMFFKSWTIPVSQTVIQNPGWKCMEMDFMVSTIRVIYAWSDGFILDWEHAKFEIQACAELSLHFLQLGFISLRCQVPAV